MLPSELILDNFSALININQILAILSMQTSFLTLLKIHIARKNASLLLFSLGFLLRNCKFENKMDISVAGGEGRREAVISRIYQPGNKVWMLTFSRTDPRSTSWFQGGIPSTLLGDLLMTNRTSLSFPHSDLQRC